MNKNQLKEFAIYSRNKLRQDVISRLHLMDITEEGIQKPKKNSRNLIEFNTRNFMLSDDDITKYNRLVAKLEEESKLKEFSLAFDDFVEEVAYTWFNRIIAIRFMEVNGYIPHGFRVLSSPQEGVIEPEVLRNYHFLDIGFTDDQILTLDGLSLKGDIVSQNKMFEIIFIQQCHSLNDNLPELFEKTEDYKDFLFSISFTDPLSVVYKLIKEVTEAGFDINSEDGSGQIQIIGWLYQYYNTEKKDFVIDILKGKPIRFEDIPAATQVFTPEWIVKYMVDNSLGKYWIERNPNSQLKEELEFLIPHSLEITYEKTDPKEIKIMDNAMGSGHILIYSFDVLMKIYVSEGYQPREAVKFIIENNIHGLDIDKRAYQLSYFSLMMKAI